MPPRRRDGSQSGQGFHRIAFRQIKQKANRVEALGLGIQTDGRKQRQRFLGKDRFGTSPRSQQMGVQFYRLIAVAQVTIISGEMHLMAGDTINRT